MKTYTLFRCSSREGKKKVNRIFPEKIQIIKESENVELLEKEVLKLYRDEVDCILNEGFHDGNGGWITEEMLDTINKYEHTSIKYKNFTNSETEYLYGQWMGIIVKGLNIEDTTSKDEIFKGNFEGFIREYKYRLYEGRYVYYIIVKNIHLVIPFSYKLPFNYKRDLGYVSS